VARFFRNENLLPGEKRGATVCTSLGTIFAPQATGVADGDVLVTVRPEQVGIVQTIGPNCVSADVKAVTYMGTHNLVEAMVGGQIWSIAAPPDLVPIPGSRVILRLPESHVWLMPTNVA